MRYPVKGANVPALERSRKWLFCVPVPIADDKTMHPCRGGYRGKRCAY
jgi:hypothetical protein